MSTNTVLIVEDSEDDVFFLKRALKDAAIRNPLQIASDGQQALDYLEGKDKFADREKYPLPFLILLDLKLPYVMGLDVLKWIRDRPLYQNIIIVVLTSSQQDSDVETTYRLGGNSYMIKPPTKTKLIELVKSLEGFGLKAG